MMQFFVENTQGLARKGRLILTHGTVETPVFMPVGTLGAVKTVSPDELNAAGTQMILGNAYHLFLRPGLELLRRFEGLHRFMAWSKPILTDSGGFQVFSLARGAKVSEEGVVFRSHLNGDRIEFTPELSAQIQQIIGSDIAMAFDECVALPNSHAIVEAAVDRSYRWAERFLSVPRRSDQALFGIIQGGTDSALREKSLSQIRSLPFDGLAIGGLSVGETQTEMVGVLQALGPILPPKKPHYLMGVGTPHDILEAVRCGVDMFDCVLPTRNARNGGLFTDDGLLNIRNQCYSEDPRPVVEGCCCPCCRAFSRAYLRHLFQAKEILGCRLATLHNLHYYHALMSEIRAALGRGEFEAFYARKKPVLARAYPERSSPTNGETGLNNSQRLWSEGAL